MPLDQLFALLACAILVALGTFQAALICGAPWGKLAWGGQHRVLPAKLKFGSAMSLGIYTVLAYAALGKASIVTPFINESFNAVTMWVMAAYFLLGTVMNGISRSRPERLIMAPTTLVLAVLYVTLAMQ